jgi:DNA-binding beta-propeller fold protein YncE
MRYRTFLLAAASVLVGGAALAAPPKPGYHVEAKIALPDGGWDLASFDPALGRVYIARGQAVTSIEVASGEVTGKLTPADGGHAVVALKNGAEILVTNGHANTAEIYDAHSGALLATIKTGQKPDAAIFDEATGLAVVMNGKSGDLTLIDPATRSAVGSIDVGGALELGAGDGAGRLFVNVEDKNEVAVVDLRARKVLRHIPLTGCDGPTGLGYLPLARRVVSSCVNGVAAVTDPDAGKVVALLPIGQGPDSVLVDARRHVAFVTAGKSGELDLFADTPAGVRPLGKIATQTGAKTGALDPATGKVYLPAADYDPPAQAGGRPQVKPGTVVALVVAP